ncbi:hypothetical protein C8Q74DRAFT_1313294 [Fomes fomentarius]|nr:hypothetical protein C8Q74DRAFT_1313294 [Fomes fomentarius]
MHRAALRVPIRHALAPQRRSFVSTVLLTKAWESETVSELKKEAKRRGLSSSGSKATLVTRLQQDDKGKTFATEPAPASQVRRASTSTGTATEVPGIPSTAETTHPKYNLAFKIPNTDVPAPEVPVAIPFVPDLWESSKLKHESAPAPQNASLEPKVVVVAGAATHHGGGPSHNLYSSDTSSSSASSTPLYTRKTPTSDVGKLLADMADDVGIPTTFQLRGSGDAQYDVAAQTQTFAAQQGKSYSRTLDGDEKKGLWVLFGVFAGSWIAASLFAPVSEWAHKTEKKAQDVQEKTSGKKH